MVLFKHDVALVVCMHCLQFSLYKKSLDQNLPCRHCNTLIKGDELWATQNCVLTLGCISLKFKC